MKTIYTVAAGLVAGVALAAAAVTYAQPMGGMGQGAGPGMGFAHGMARGSGQGSMANMDPAAMADSHLADLKTQLHVTSEQETAWQAFADAARQQATGMQAMRAQMQSGSGGTAPERMAQRASAMQQRAAAMTTMTSAFNVLYAVLTPEQKAIADQHFGNMGPGAMRHASHAG